MVEHTPTPWRYRPDHYDDWGWIKGPDGKLTATARAPADYDADEHRALGTDPYEPNATFIVKAVNNHEALVKALEPFAAIAEYVTETQRDSRPVIFGMDNVVLQRLTIGHLRIARAALSSLVGRASETGEGK